MQQELESIQAKLERHEARLEKVRSRIDEAEASSNREELKQLQALELELLGVIRELQAEKNRLSSQSAAAAAAAGGGGAPAAADSPYAPQSWQKFMDGVHDWSEKMAAKSIIYGPARPADHSLVKKVA
ncbi:hypothetical protein OEZ86_005072 [Tetradesmus obliquus]|nr:hypothetical protein OEZ86_005072 [Tetradesmus obliquus]